MKIDRRLSLAALLFSTLVGGCISSAGINAPPTSLPALSPLQNTSNIAVAWSSVVPITDTGAEAILPTLGAEGNITHVAWIDFREGEKNSEIFYRRSPDNGSTWPEPDTRLSFASCESIRPSFAISRGTVNLFWRDDRGGNFEIFLRQSPDGGLSWSQERRLTTDPGYSGCPFPIVNGGNVYLFWRDNRLGTFRIYYKQSGDSGYSWGPDTLLTPYGVMSEFPYPVLDGDTIHLAWRDNRDGNAEIYYMQSTDDRKSWMKDQRLTNDPAESEHPKLAAEDNCLYLVWRDKRDGNAEIYFKKSRDWGQTWSADKRLTDTPGPSLWPVIVACNDTLHLLWAENERGTQVLYYLHSRDKGDTWSETVKISDCTIIGGIMGAHTMIVKEPYIHVVFNDRRAGHNQTCYIRGTISYG